MEDYELERVCEKLENYRARKILYDAEPRNTPKPRPPKYEDSVDQGHQNARRFMGVVRAPYLDACTGSSSWGYYCIACRIFTIPQNNMDHWSREFTKEGLEAHIRKRGRIAGSPGHYWHLAP